MMTRQEGIINWSKSHNSPLEYSKLALIDFAHQNSPKPRTLLHLPHRTIEPVTHAKYLGVIFDQNLKWNTQLAHVAEKGSKWAAQIKRAARPSWGITPKYARRLYISVAIPKILYAIDIWCTPPHGIETRPSARGSAIAVSQIAKVQRAGTLAITGGLCTSPTDALDACAFTIPASQLAEKRCHSAAVRLSTLPPAHPLYKIVKSGAKPYILTHRTPIHNLMQTYKLNPDTTAKIEVAVRNPLKANSTPFRISIADSKELSKAESSAATETIKIYTDGSVINNKVGAAAVLMKPGKPPQVLHYYLGSETKHTIHEAELVGLCMGAHFIKTEKKGRTSFALGADSQAAIKTLTTNLIQPAQHIALNLLKTTAQIQEKRGSNKYSLTLRWTAGHVGIEGNERADKEAKIAAGGTTSDRKLLPPFLRRNLVTNPIALKQHHNKTIKHKWKTKWRSSQRGAKMVVLDETTPSSTFLNTISGHKLTCKASSTLAQLRIGHIPPQQLSIQVQARRQPQMPGMRSSSGVDPPLPHHLPDVQTRAVATPTKMQTHTHTQKATNGQQPHRTPNQLHRGNKTFRTEARNGAKSTR
jgi:ribonuclease HI